MVVDKLCWVSRDEDSEVDESIASYIVLSIVTIRTQPADHLTGWSSLVAETFVYFIQEDVTTLLKQVVKVVLLRGQELNVRHWVALVGESASSFTKQAPVGSKVYLMVIIVCLKVFSLLLAVRYHSIHFFLTEALFNTLTVGLEGGL